MLVGCKVCQWAAGHDGGLQDMLVGCRVHRDTSNVLKGGAALSWFVP